MNTIYAGKCACGHVTTHWRARRLTGDWRFGYDGECSGQTRSGDTCGEPIFLRCMTVDERDRLQAA